MRTAAYKGAAAMKRKVLVVILASILVCAWGGVGVAGQIGYSMRSAEKGFVSKPNPEPPSSTAMAFDGLIGRPLGAAASALGIALLVVETPLTLHSGTTSEAAWGLVGRPVGWTFSRPLGRGAPEYEEKGVFKP
jgi:hypothetical protein